MSLDNPAKRYKVCLCASCAHPGGQHFGGACQLCECAEWIEGQESWWSDLATLAAKPSPQASTKGS
jgi:hypothetical protein